MTWKSKIDDIATDRRSGATSIATRTAEALRLMFETETFSSQEKLVETLQDVAYRLVSGQPEMASVTGLLNEIFFATTGAPDLSVAREAVIKTAETFIDHIQETREKVVQKARGLIPGDVTVLTHTRSSTVTLALTQAARSKRQIKVYCQESRPLCEGRDMAGDLAEAGIEVMFTVDAAAYRNILKCELVLMGADSLTEQGVLNKIGTASIAVSAQSLGVPVYILAETAKIWPAKFGSPLVNRHPPEQVWNDSPHNIEIVNHYFDLTPWQAIAGIVTEHGLLTPDEICTISRERPINQYLQTIIAEVRSSI